MSSDYIGTRQIEAVRKVSSHWAWTHLKDNPTRFFGSGANSFYDSDTIKGYISNGHAIGHWTLAKEKNGPILEETIFIY